MIVIDGSSGEGGGQMLRSSLSLSLVTGNAFRLENVRAKRSKPGLLRQHLTAVRAATEVGHARVTGADLGSREVEFHPETLRAGDYTFRIGTAGSATLVLQTLLPALLFASGPSSVTIEGGTHNPQAPSFDFLDRAYLPLLRRMGADVTATLARSGFYPAGGGRFTVKVNPSPMLSPITLDARGEVLTRRVIARVAALPRTVAEREVGAACELLGWDLSAGVIESLPRDEGPGNVVIIEVASEHVTEVFTACGEKGRPAETVAEDAVREARAYLDAGVPVGEHLADQLLLPMALAGGGAFRTTAPTAHTRTHVDVIGRFLGASVTLQDSGDGTWRVAVERAMR